MIDIKDKKECCGCSACIQKCPKQCISLQEDNEGFLYPLVDKANCIDCGLCEKVCPVLHQNEPRRPLKAYAAINKNEEKRLQSSSGGVFTLLAEKIINEGGVVFGARFDDNWEVMHDYTDTIEGLAAFRGSKYVQSRIEDNFKKAENFLKEGRKVLFSGTPCQIAGLKRYLRKEYDNLLTVDFICHGVPSPGVWRRYLKETIAHECDKNSVLSDPISKESSHIESISFRNKSTGWEKYSFSLTFSALTTRERCKKVITFNEIYFKNLFMKGFLADLYLRPSCYDCPSKCSKSGSDLTIADLWKASKVIGKKDDDKGICLLIDNSKKCGFASLDLFYEEIDVEQALINNPVFYKSVKYPQKRLLFYEKYFLNEKISSIVRILTRISIWKRALFIIKRIIKKIIGRK